MNPISTTVIFFKGVGGWFNHQLSVEMTLGKTSSAKDTRKGPGFGTGEH